MKEINMAKFTLNETLGQKLLKTRDILLVYREEDRYLANGDKNRNNFGAGQNKMGEILMWVRSELLKRQQGGGDIGATKRNQKEVPHENGTADAATKAPKEGTEKGDVKEGKSNGVDSSASSSTKQKPAKEKKEQVKSKDKAKNKGKKNRGSEKNGESVLAWVPASSTARLASPKPAIPQMSRRPPQRGATTSRCFNRE